MSMIRYNYKNLGSSKTKKSGQLKLKFGNEDFILEYDDNRSPEYLAFIDNVITKVCHYKTIN